MIETKQRSLFYRRVTWINGVNNNLEQLMTQAHTMLLTTEKRTFEYNEGQIQGLSIESRPTGFFCHVGYCIPSQPASLIPIPSQNKMQDTSVQEPPPKHDFLQGDIFFVIKDNHIILCPSNLNEHAAIDYIKQVLEKTGKEYLLREFSIDSVIHANKLKILNDEGVKKVSLNTAIYTATHDYVARKSVKESMISGVRHVLEEFLCESDESQEVKNKENLSVKLEISFDSRKKGEICKKKLEALAEKSINEEGFTIITRKDKKMTYDEIRISTKAILAVEGSSVSKEAAWNDMEAYFKKLKSTGMLEQ